MDELKESPDKIYEFYCTSPECNNIVFKAIHYNKPLCCPHCNKQLILKELLEHDLQQKEKIRKSREFIEKQLIIQHITEEQIDFLERKYEFNYRLNNRPDTFDPELREKKPYDEKKQECDQSPKPELKPA